MVKNDVENENDIGAPRFPMVVPLKFNEREAREMITKQWMGNRKFSESIVSIGLLWLPHYDINLSAKIDLVEKTGWFSKEKVSRTVEAKVTFDANTGVLIRVDKDGLSYKYAMLAQLDSEQRRLLRVVGADSFEKRDIRMGDASPNKVGQRINDMASKYTITQVRARPATYKALVEYPSDPRTCGSISGKYYITRTDLESTAERKIDPGEIIKLASTYWDNVSVNTVECIYYPYYVAELKNEEGTKRTISIDGVTRTRCNELE